MTFVSPRPHLTAALLLLTAAACGGKPNALSPEQPPLVTVAKPGLSDVIDIVSFTGTINARDELPISLDGDSARIAAILVEVGDRVRKGQLLARLNPSIAAPQFASLAAALDEAKASADLAAGDYRRGQAVASSGALSGEEIERRRGVAAAAQAKVKAARAQLAESRARLGRTEIRAPADGIVLTRSAEVGQTATIGGEPLFRLGRGGEVEMRGLVAEQELPKLAVGQDVQIRIAGSPAPFPGKVRLLGAVIDPQNRMGSVRVSLAQNSSLRPGAFARAEATVSHAKHVVLPQTAILTDLKGNYVLVLDEQDIVRRRDVKVAGTRNAGVVIDSGLSGVERVVATAAAFLHEGEKVRPVEAKS